MPTKVTYSGRHSSIKELQPSIFTGLDLRVLLNRGNGRAGSEVIGCTLLDAQIV